MQAYALLSTPPDRMRFRRLVGARGSLAGMTAACFLLYRPPQGDHGICVDRFLFHLAPILLQQLSRTTQPQRVTLHGRIRGRVDWANTYKARYTEDLNPTVFVCQQSWRRFDQPENQLFKYLLHGMQLCLERVSPQMRQWRAWGRALRSPGGGPLDLHDYLARVEHRVRTFRAHVYLRAVTLPDTISGQHLLAARTSKNELYAEVAELYDLYRSVVDAPDARRWAEALSETMPLPPEADEISRLWAA
jgi:hypothetical protein